MLPDVDGWEVYRQINGDDKVKDTPVIVITAKTQGIDRVLGAHIARVHDQFTEPSDPQELTESVAGILGADH